MTVREYLHQVRDIRSTIRFYEKELEVIEDTTSSASGEAAQEVRRIKAKINNEIVEYFRTENEIREKILALPNKKYRELLYGYYINCMTLEEVAELMERDFDYIRHLHGWALEYFRKFYGFQKKI